LFIVEEEVMKRFSFRHAFSALAATLALMLVAATSATAADVCGTPQVSTLWAGQTINAGTVTVSNPTSAPALKEHCLINAL
jgi:hypothetical protein